MDCFYVCSPWRVYPGRGKDGRNVCGNARVVIMGVMVVLYVVVVAVYVVVVIMGTDGGGVCGGGDGGV